MFHFRISLEALRFSAAKAEGRSMLRHISGCGDQVGWVRQPTIYQTELKSQLLH